VTTPITDWRIARSKIGQAGAGTLEEVELDFNIGSDEAIEIASVQGLMNMATATGGSTQAPVVAQQNLHIEDGTIELTLDTDVSAADQFDNDSEVFYSQAVNESTFNGTTEASSYLTVTPSSQVVYREPIISPINITHAVKLITGITVIAIVLIEYRYVRLSDRELAFQFARRRR